MSALREAWHGDGVCAWRVGQAPAAVQALAAHAPFQGWALMSALREAWRGDGGGESRSVRGRAPGTLEALRGAPGHVDLLIPHVGSSTDIQPLGRVPH